MKTRWLFLGVGALIMVVLLLAGFRSAWQPYTFRGSLIDPPAAAADIELPDQNQQMFRLSDQRGKIVLVTFGYTNCPDVCPVLLAHFKQIKTELGDESEGVRFVFITVDPDRDTFDRLKEYIPNFDAEIFGLTGSRADLESVWKSYGVYQAKQDTGSSADYLVDHTARTYLIDQDGNWRLTYPFETEADDILADVRHLLASN